jgi:hypothetical protein
VLTLMGRFHTAIKVLAVSMKLNTNTLNHYGLVLV